MTPSLQEAINLARAGQKEKARVLFMQIIQQNPRDETAWLWLVDCLPDDQARAQALETCLRFNPESHRARIALDLLPGQTTSGGADDTAGLASSLSPEQPVQPEPPEPDHENPLPQVGGFEIKGDISTDFLHELEEESRPVEKIPPRPAFVPYERFEIEDEPLDEPAAPEPTPKELSAEDQLVQSLRKPKRWNFHFPTFSKGKPGTTNPSGSRARRRVIVLLSLLILLVAVSAAMLGHPNFKVPDLSGIFAQFKLPGGLVDNPTPVVDETASSPALTPTGSASPTSTVSPTTSPSTNSLLPTGQAGAPIALGVDPAAALPRPLSQHTASLLPGGQILLVGGFLHGGGYGYSYLYDPAAGTFTQSASLLTGRYGHSAVLLSDGRLVVTGGMNLDGDVFTAEIYDPASGAWKRNTMAFDHGKGHTATLLANGQVLVAGGCTPSGPSGAAELYNPEANSWTKVERMPGNYCNASATLLPDGRVLIVGESDTAGPTALIYDPGKSGWTQAAALHTPRSSLAATLLPDGRVLVSGGQNSRLGALNSVEVYDPVKDAWTELGAMRDARFGHAAVLLPDARLVVIGGFDRTGGAPLDTVEVYYPGSDAWSEPAQLINGLGAFSATLLPEGKVFLAGGTTDGQNNTDTTEMIVLK